MKIISAAIAATNAKPSIGKRSVHLQWHTKEEYNKLTKAQKKELYEWRAANPDVAKLPEKMQTEGKGEYYTKKQISSLVTTKHVKLELNKETEEKKEQDEDAAYIMSLVQNAVTTASSAVTNISLHMCVLLPPLPFLLVLL